jgi:hypothetical protein
MGNPQTGGAPAGLRNDHLAGRRFPEDPQRLWWAYRDPFFPLDRLEPFVVVDSNGQRERTFVLPAGGQRTWKLRDLNPSAQKQAELRSFYQELSESIQREGVRLPILVWQAPSGEYFLRYGASRVKVARDLNMVGIPAVVCSFRERPANDHFCPSGSRLLAKILEDPVAVMKAFGPLRYAGWLEVSFERIDAHHLEPQF